MSPTNTHVVATLTDKGLSLVVNGDPATINHSHINFAKIIAALRAKDHDAIPALLDVPATIHQVTGGLVKVVNGVVFYGDQEMHNSLTDRMLKMLELGLDITPLARFLENLMQNPSFRAVQELHKFMEACDMPITEDGRLLAYRSVNDDYWDTHTGKTSLSLPPDQINTVGTNQALFQNGLMVRNGVTSDISSGRCVVSMPRNMVNEDANQTCSYGLHVCSQQYGMYGKRLLLVAVNPADVVSVPTDYNSAKMRVCRYEVLKDVQSEGFKQWKDTPIYANEGVDDDGDDLSWFYDDEDDFCF